MKLLATLFTALIFTFMPLQPAIAIDISEEEYAGIDAGFDNAPAGDITRCGFDEGSLKKPGSVYIIGDALIAGERMREKIEDAFSSSLWSVEVNAEGRRRFIDVNSTNFLTDQLKDDLIDADHIVIALGGYERTFNDPNENYYEEQVQNQLNQLVNTVNGLRGSETPLYFVNTGSNADGTGKDGTELEEPDFQPATLERFGNINRDIEGFSSVYNYEVVDWYRYVFGLDSSPSAIDPTLEDTGDFLENNEFNLTEAGEDAWLSNLLQSVTGSSSVTDENGDLDNSSGGQAVGSGVLDGKYRLPAVRGGVAKEGDVGPDGRLTTKNSADHDIGDEVSFPQHASEGQEYRDYYIAMRWRYVGWQWDGGSTTDGAPEDVGWYAEEPRKVLVTNPGSGKSIIAAILEAGPAPWTGTVGGEDSKDNPPDYWGGPDDYRVDTPVEYDGRVAGLTELGMEYLEAEQWMHGGPNSEHAQGAGSELLFAWAPQDATPGPTELSVSNIGCLTGNTVGIDGVVFPLQDITREVLARGSSNEQGTLMWPSQCLEEPGGKGKCHHNYNAADLHVSPGWPVIAMKGGTLVSMRRAEDKAGGRMQIRGEDDQFLYYYAHLDPGSIPEKFDADGEVTVEAGELLGFVGASRYANDTAPHVHVDVLPPSYDVRPSCSGEECEPYDFLDVQSTLVRLYGAIPNE